MKRNIFLISVSMILLMAIIAGCYYFPETPSVDNQQPTAPIVLDSEPTEQSLEAIQPTEMSETVLTADYNGISAEIKEFDLDPEHPYIMMCTDIPSVADWLPIFSATYNEEPIDVWMVQVIDEDNTAYKSINRCYKALLKEGIIQADKPGILTFTMDHFRMAIPEVYPDDLLKKANKYLSDSGNGVAFEMKNVDHGQVFEITQKPDNITAEQANQFVEQAIDQSIDKVFGPWIFTINLSQ